MALLFELRFAYAIYRAGIEPNYEVEGEGTSTLDFGFTSCGQRWAIELMRLDETEAVKSATHEQNGGDGIKRSSRLLITGNENQKQTVEHQMLKAVWRICEKCEHDGSPHKFPFPDGTIHAILADFRNVRGDAWDLFHIALGGEYVRPELQYRWNGNLISGVFSKNNRCRGARYVRERVHFLGFVEEHGFADGDFSRSIRFVANPNILASIDAVRNAIATWPLPWREVLNIPKSRGC